MPGSEVLAGQLSIHHFSGSLGIRHHLGSRAARQPVIAGPSWGDAAAKCIRSRTCGLCPPPPRMNPCTMMRTTGQQSSL